MDGFRLPGIGFDLTARQHELLRFHAWAAADSAFDDVEERGSDEVVVGGWWYIFDRLPSCTFTQGIDWRRSVAQSCADLADDLEAGRPSYPRTTAEQLALLLIIEDASTALAHHEYGVEVATLAADARDDDWLTVTNALTNQSALAALYDPRLAPTWLKVMPMESWFAFHDPAQTRDPNRLRYR